ncbi:MAG: arsenate reductase (thioredoxin) [Gammaproteobacteria bacterium]|nr:arsenate reductase (thioredoxin) [Gammaproteobacteria bacterium]
MASNSLLFLCTGNSCRSQMCEGYAKQLFPDEWTILSAGIEAHGKNPRAISIMAEDGLDISAQESTVLSDEMIEQTHYFVTVCGHADEHCPVLPPGKIRIHWPLPDPAKATGTEEEITEQFRAVRDEVKQRMYALSAELLDEA